MNLSGKISCGFSASPFVAIVEGNNGDLALRNISINGRTAVRLRFGDMPAAYNEVVAPEDMDYLTPGDIVRLKPDRDEIRVLYRRNSRHNFLFFTDRCNSRCLMCSQPPRTADDSYLVDDILLMIPWMAKDTGELGITGGEPTFLHGKLLDVIRAVKTHLPATALHMLTNGRLFSYLRYAQRLATVGHSDFMVGVPLYADTAANHDFVVQAKGAFEQTVFGLLNLARVGVRIELRMVIHQQTYRRLPQFARFVARNLPFVDQVALMGLELMGYTRSNLDKLWMEPTDYWPQLQEAVNVLDGAGIKVHIFNHPLCLLPADLHTYARQSISDWKNIYLPKCDACALKPSCSGLFASSALRPPARLRPFTAALTPVY